jgi:hypothetical protein
MGDDYVTEFHNLARKIALNLIHVSIDEAEVEDAVKMMMEMDLDGRKFDDARYSPERFVVVVGAGASYNANKNIFLAEDAKKRIREVLIGDNTDIDNLIENELDRLETVYKLKRDEFETELFALSRFYSSTKPGEKNLVNEVCKLYNHMYYPSLTYELLAHMFKHRFLDVIINFNFDEVLDRAIEDELCQGDYCKVIYDGDSPTDISELMTKNKFKKPLYIKPHGTASHKSTLRFTREDYFRLPIDIENLLGIVLGGEIDSSRTIPVNIIAIGFGMQSVEFNKILNIKLPEGSKIYYINRKRFDFGTLEPKKLKEKFVPYGFFPIRKTNPLISGGKINKIHSYLDEMILQLWKSVQKNFRPFYKPRTIKRHQLISKLFASKETREPKSPAKIQDYLKDRTYIELVLSIAKAKGFLNMQQLTNDRTGMYFNLYTDQTIKNRGAGDDRTSDKDSLSLFQFCNKLGLVGIGYGRQALKLILDKDPKKDLEENIKKNLIVKEKSFKKDYVNKLYKTLIEDDLLTLRTKKQLKKSKGDFSRTLKELYMGQEVEICPQFKNIYNNIFSSPKVLNTDMALRYCLASPGIGQPLVRLKA